VAVLMIAFDCRFLDGAVRTLDPPVSPRMLHLGQPVLDAVIVADAVEDVEKSIFVVGVIGELDAPSTSLRTKLSVSTVWILCGTAATRLCRNCAVIILPTS